MFKKPDFHATLRKIISDYSGNPPSDTFIHNAARMADQAYADRYKKTTVGPDGDGKFSHEGGHEPFAWTAHKAVASRITDHLWRGGSDDLNTLAGIAHKAYGSAVERSKDPNHNGEVRHARSLKAATPYHALSADEQNKDRVVAAAVLKHWKDNHG